MRGAHNCGIWPLRMEFSEAVKQTGSLADFSPDGQYLVRIGRRASPRGLRLCICTVYMRRCADCQGRVM